VHTTVDHNRQRPFLTWAVHGRQGDGSLQALLAATEYRRIILPAVVRGQANKGIARCLGVTEGAIEFHTDTIHQKLGIPSRTEAIGLALRRGFVHLE
jgi:NarL family two-component system response regulator YdfI